MLTPNCFPIHLRLLGQGMFKPCLRYRLWWLVPFVYCFVWYPMLDNKDILIRSEGDTYHHRLGILRKAQIEAPNLNIFKSHENAIAHISVIFFWVNLDGSFSAARNIIHFVHYLSPHSDSTYLTLSTEIGRDRVAHQNKNKTDTGSAAIIYWYLGIGGGI